jgi:hypothetical protein
MRIVFLTFVILQEKVIIQSHVIKESIGIYNVSMETTKRLPQPRCSYCGRFFKPDKRTKEWQKSCQSMKCQSMRKKEAQQKWLAANSDYFTGRYADTKQWRQIHPDYQRRWRLKRRESQKDRSVHSSVRSLRILVPVQWLKGEIQKEILLVKQGESDFFVPGEISRNRNEGHNF